LLVLAAGCGSEPHIELQIADPELPFLLPDQDYDAMLVEATAMGCADTEMRYDPSPLPATLTVLPGACYREVVLLRASVLDDQRRVAQSGWLRAEFPSSGAAVVTATLSDVPGRRVLYASGFEPGDPFAELGPLPVVLAEGIAGLDARTSTAGALTGERTALLSGTATSAPARALARIAVTNLVIAGGDELVLSFELDARSEVLEAGIDLELSTGANAESLGLADRNGRPIHPGSAAGREPGVRQQWAIDLSAAAGARVVGVLIGVATTSSGAFAVRADDIALVRP
jgi:hypothetical protein